MNYNLCFPETSVLRHGLAYDISVTVLIGLSHNIEKTRDQNEYMWEVS